MGRELQLALDDCNEALRLSANSASTLDSRGLTYLKLGRLDDAMADYEAALKLNPKIAASLFGRGMVKLRKGDGAGGNADMASAKALQADIVEVFAHYGVTQAVAATSAPFTTASSGPRPASDCSQAETHWKSAETIGILAVYEDHLKRFPGCDFALLAKAKIEMLKK